MKHLAREFLFNAFALWFTSQLIPGFIINNSWLSVLEGAFFLSILTLLVKPILKILFIPINLMTLGLLSWGVNVIVVYLLTVIDLNVKVIPWIFEGFTYGGFVVPATSISYFASLVITTLVLTIFTNLLQTIRE